MEDGGNPKGRCYGIGTKEEMTEDQCKTLGGETKEPDTICFVKNVLTRSLADSILKLGPSYYVAFEFRSELLLKTRVGRLGVERYDSHTTEIYEIVQRDIELLGACLQAWPPTVTFANAMLNVALGREEVMRRRSRTRLFRRSRDGFATHRRTWPSRRRWKSSTKSFGFTRASRPKRQ